MSLSSEEDVHHTPSPSGRQHGLGAGPQGKAATYSIHRPHAVTRPVPFFYPTRAVFVPHANADDVQGSLDRAPSAHWSSRASRKNRYARRPIHVMAHPPADERRTHDISLPHKELVLLEQRVRNSQSQYKVHLAWDISFWVAVVFVLGSIIWVVNGFILFLPLVNAGSDNFPASAWSAFVGGTLFEIGSYLMYVEALNTGHEQLFGPALRELLEHGNGTVAEDVSPSSDDSHVEKGSRGDSGHAGGGQRFKFRWITGLPNVISGFPDDPPTAITDVFYWTPQVVGGCGFIISSLLLMVEVQRKWWFPNLSSLGWHIGFWNLVGAVGFMLCGALGYASLASSGVNYQSVLSTFWGSWAFLIGSVIQLWETLWREDPPKEDS
ncbi:hypothetical protein BN946_scf184937.g25 [Trametes cinnabarina]|uniref:Integral membrane protein n=1 Tax=Pycnoporus cinnabarinus TaxID=5643 RepID=A0A060SQH7_PYCCI|nr:hypothetical protein BN946_scf184937.g25 [Trametes cinnabarina]